MLIRSRTALSLAALMLGCVAAAAFAADSTTANAEGGAWVPHKYTFNFMGFTTTYSCEGLEDKLRLLLQMSGAGPTKSDVKVVAPCVNQLGRPDKLAFAYLTFNSLQPPPDSAPGQWRHVVLSPRHPYQLDYGDCELIEQFRDRVLPMFITRDVKNNVTCIPHQNEGSNFYLSYDVFAPSPALAP
jgi:hypothetical protein